MKLREDVKNCVRERVLNKTENGKVFKRDEDYLAWLFGSETDRVEGFLENPAAALSRTIEGSTEAPGHKGVAMSSNERDWMREIVSSLNFGNVSSRFASGSTASAMASVAFVGPLLAEIGGY